MAGGRHARAGSADRQWTRQPGPAGRLILPAGARRVTFLVGGVGVTPVRSMLRDAAHRAEPWEDAAVFYGNGSKDFSVASVLGRCRFDYATKQWTWHREYLPTTFDYVPSQHSQASPDEEEPYDDQVWDEGEKE